MRYNLKLFWCSLKNHPGVLFVILMQAFGFVAGLKHVDHVFDAWRGAAVMGIFWIPVFWTAWTGRIYYKDHDCHDYHG